MSKSFLAVDLGASGGKTFIGTLSNKKLSIKEISRFWNGPVDSNGTLYWDFDKLLTHIKKGITTAHSSCPLSSIAIDTWGVDFGLIDKNGKMIRQPVHYRDSRTKGMLKEAFKILPKEAIFEQTGIQFMELNTLYQCMSIRKSSNYRESKNMLFSPDLLNYMLTGEKVAERTIASTSQLYNPHKKTWAVELIKSFDLRLDLLPQIVDPGTILGQYKDINVIAGAGHDTACAFTATPISANKKSAILSSGTWSLFGCELDHPIINKSALNEEFTNEVGVCDTIRFLKNMNGLWIIQELRHMWNKNGYSYTFEDMVSMAKKATPFQFFIDPSNEDFFAPGDMENRIIVFCKKTNQRSPKSHGEIIRTAFEGLSFLYAKTFHSLKKITNIEFEVIHIVGGGSQNHLLNQMTASAIGLPVISGPVEATAIGNILVQIMSSGEIKNLSEGREIVKASFKKEIHTFYPQENTKHKIAMKQWADLYSGK